MMVVDLNRKNQEASKIEIKEVISYGCSVCIKIGPDSTCNGNSSVVTFCSSTIFTSGQQYKVKSD